MDYSNTFFMLNDKETRKITDYFKGTSCEKHLKNVVLIDCEKTHPKILKLTQSNGSPRYFKIGKDLIEKVKTVFEQNIVIGKNGLHPDIEKMLSHLKDKAESTFQIHLDISPDSVGKTIEILKEQPGFQECFQVPPVKEGYVRFAANILPPNYV